ncbi:hypothetical protein ACTOB_001663 [Actinoplanes oblitus]|uniref:Uncharacterized protein n=1 Tax=Actinoplanes oblitus TaxID=3040509 RepID=A0ABY8WJP3_9ACTN|nr:hypothetical protein [Actinoplanes oblitus]WIM98089.1 hypothetical protein ACTOB_001663 [Actinoplanes oblitus]
MSLWPRIRAELRGAWRSVKYDLGRRPPEPADGPDVTSTGLSTFPGSLMEWRTPAAETDAKPPRRFVAVTVLCLVAMLAAAGSYLLVTRGLTSAFADQPVAAPAPVADPSSTPAAEPTARLGTITRRRATPPHATVPMPDHRPVAQPQPREPGTTDPAAPPGPAPVRPRTTTATPECHCVTPPAPTPTAPSPAASTTVPADPSPSEPVSAGPSAPPSPSTDASTDADSSGAWRQHHRHWQEN